MSSRQGNHIDTVAHEGKDVSMNAVTDMISNILNVNGVSGIYSMFRVSPEFLPKQFRGNSVIHNSISN